MDDREKKQTGRRGEDEACRYLEEHGHYIIERNWRSGHLEIDIITIDKDGLHFVEVKSRKAPATADPEVGLDWKKQRHLVSAAGKYLRDENRKSAPGMEIFFDAVTVLFDGDEVLQLNYYPQAYIPIYT